MIFSNEHKIISRGRKATEIEKVDNTIIKEVLKNLFNGKYNRKEILQVLSKVEQIQKKDPLYVKKILDEIGLSNWYYQHLDGGFKLKCATIINLLELNTSDDFDTVVIGETSRTDGVESIKNVKKDMDTIIGTYKEFMKEFKEQL